MTQAEFFQSVMEARWANRPLPGNGCHPSNSIRISANAIRMAYQYGAIVDLSVALRAVMVMWPDDSTNTLSLDGSKFL